MALLFAHIQLFDALLRSLDPEPRTAIIFGVQEVRIPAAVRQRICSRASRFAYRLARGFGWQLPSEEVLASYNHITLSEAFAARGMSEVRTIDLFDSRATYRHDMNWPIGEEIAPADLVVDIGSTEHVFDTSQCFLNLIRLVRLGGHMILHLPVSGYLGHGLHVFHPGLVTAVLEENGFTVRLQFFSTARGSTVRVPRNGADTLMWVSATKRERKPFSKPQQHYWQAFYSASDACQRAAVQRKAWQELLHL